MQNDFLPQSENIFNPPYYAEIQLVCKKKKQRRLLGIIIVLLMLTAGIMLFLFRTNEEYVDLGELLPGDIIIMLDAGHGGKDSGSTAAGIREKDLNLSMTLKLGQLLEEKGYTVFYTRKFDEFIALDERAALANRKKAHIFISMHCNSFTDTDANGMEVYYNDEKDADSLAKAVYDELLGALGTKGRDYAFAGYTVLSKSKMPAILVEAGFLSNDEERAMLIDPDFQTEVVQAVAKGIESFIYGDAD